MRALTGGWLARLIVVAFEVVVFMARGDIGGGIGDDGVPARLDDDDLVLDFFTFDVDVGLDDVGSPTMLINGLVLNVIWPSLVCRLVGVKRLVVVPLLPATIFVGDVVVDDERDDDEPRLLIVVCCSRILVFIFVVAVLLLLPVLGRLVFAAAAAAAVNIDDSSSIIFFSYILVFDILNCWFFCLFGFTCEMFDYCLTKRGGADGL